MLLFFFVNYNLHSTYHKSLKDLKVQKDLAGKKIPILKPHSHGSH